MWIVLLYHLRGLLVETILWREEICIVFNWSSEFSFGSEVLLLHNGLTGERKLLQVFGKPDEGSAGGDP